MLHFLRLCLTDTHSDARVAFDHSIDSIDVMPMRLMAADHSKTASRLRVVYTWCCCSCPISHPLITAKLRSQSITAYSKREVPTFSKTVLNNNNYHDDPITIIPAVPYPSVSLHDVSVFGTLNTSPRSATTG